MNSKSFTILRTCLLGVIFINLFFVNCAGWAQLTGSSILPGSAIIPDERRIDWSKAGVMQPDGTLGIPNRTNMCADFSLASVRQQYSSDTAGIQLAIDNCSKSGGGVVFLPQGTYNLSAVLRVKSNVTLRGAGMGLTSLKGAAGFTENFVAGIQDVNFDYAWNDTNAISYNLDISGSPNGIKGLKEITTTAPHNFKVGDYILIDELQDKNADPPVTIFGNEGANCTWCSRDNGVRPVAQWNKVTKLISTTKVELETPLHWNFKRTPQATKSIGVTQYAGLEDLTIDNSVSKARDASRADFAANSWYLRVEIIGSNRRALDFWGGYRNIVRSSILHDGVPLTPVCGGSAPAYTSNRAYGIFMNMGISSSIFEDNIFHSLSIAIALEGGPSGNVIAYNFISPMFYRDCPPYDWARLAISAHGAHPMMNLIESNWIEDKIAADYSWGSSSHQTYFRNRFKQEERWYGNWNIDLYQGAWYHNLVGNVIGTPGVERIYQIDGAKNYPYDLGRSIYRLGYFSASGNEVPDFKDSGTERTLMRWGNWDSVNGNGSISYKANEIPVGQAVPTTQSIPPSLYLNQKPSWWNVDFSTITWPAIGPDPANPSQLLDGNIPAKLRYDRLSARPVVTTQPLSRTVAAGQTVTFSVTAMGDPALSYQWQKKALADAPQGGTDITGFFNITGATSASYTTPAITTAYHDQLYRCTVTNAKGKTVSHAALLKVSGVSDPLPVVAYTVSVTKSGGGLGTISGGGIFCGATCSKSMDSGTQLILTAQPDSLSQFNGWSGDCSGTNVTCTLSVNANTAVTAVFNVLPPSAPVITTPPQSQTVGAGSTATFTVQAQGNPGPLSYQWQKNGVNLPVTNNTNYTTPAALLSDDGHSYRVIVTNLMGSTISSSAILRVVDPLLTFKAHWKFDEASGTTAGDSSGNGYNGALRNGPLWAEGRLGKALIFDGINDYVEVGDLDISPSVTVSLWLKQDASLSGWGSLAMKRMTYGFEVSGSTVDFGIGNGGGWTGKASMPVTLGAWQHFVGVFNGSTISVYKNGVQVGSAVSATLTNSNTPLLIGSWDGGGEFFKGTIDDVRIYSRALSAQDVLGLFNASLVFTPAADTQAPTVPAGLTASAISVSQIDLSWNASTDNSGVSGYRIYRNGSQVLTTSLRKYSDTGLSLNTQYTYTVAAYDASGNISGLSSSVSAKTLGAAPAITTQPVNQTINEGQSVTFTVIASGTAPLNYQWQKNGVNISGATNASYTKSAIVFADNGSVFKCIVTNSTGTATSNNAILTVNRNNVPPVANNKPFTSNEDSPLTGTLTGSDSEGASLSFIKVSNPSHGTVTVNVNGAFVYTPVANYNGQDSFTFKVNDGFVDSTAAAVSITVNAVNDAPVANGQTVAVTTGIAKTMTLTASDIENNPLTYVVVKSPTKGTLSGTAPNLTYKPNSGFIGADSFTFKVNDGKVDSSVATVTLNVSAAVGTFPVELTGKTPESKTISVNVSKPQQASATATLTMTVYDPDNVNEGNLYINGYGPVVLFGDQAKDAHDVKTVSVTFKTPAQWWNNGANTLKFTHTATVGYHVTKVSVAF